MSSEPAPAAQEQQPSRLLNRHFVLLWQGQLVSLLGTQAYSIAILFWLKHNLESASVIGMLMMLSSLPGLLLGPVGGTLADQYSRRSIIIACDVTRGLAVLGLVVLLYHDPRNLNLLVLVLFAVSIFKGIVATFFNPAILAAVPDLVPKKRVAAANSFMQTSAQIASLAGQAAAGILYSLLGAPIFFLIDGLSYLFSGASEGLIRIPQKLSRPVGTFRQKYRNFLRDTRRGIGYVWKRTGMRNLFLAFGALGFFLQPILVLLPFYVEDFLGEGPAWLGFIFASMGAGMVSGSILAGAVRLSGWGRAMATVCGILAFSVAMAVMGIFAIPLLSLLLAFIAGLAEGFLNVSVRTSIQLTTPSEIRGRVFGLLGTLNRGLRPLGMGLGGLLADLVGRDIPLVYLSCGAIMTVFSIFVFQNKNIFSFMSSESEAPSAEPQTADLKG